MSDLPSTGPRRPLDPSPLGRLVALEDRARRASDERSLWFIATNDLHALAAHGQAVLFRWDGETRPKPLTATGLTEVDPNAPMLLWMGRVLDHLATAGSLDGETALPVTPRDLPPDEAREWADHCLPQALVLPLRDGQGRAMGILWLTRETPWSDQECLLLPRAASAMGHAWSALLPERTASGWWRRLPRRRLVWGAAALTLLLLALPVPMTALGQAQVTPRSPTIITAPMDGVIDRILVAPNRMVSEGTPLLAFTDTEARADLEVARRARAVAEADLRAARQAAFGARENSGRISVLEAELTLQEAKEDRAREYLERGMPLAPVEGLVIVTDPEDWAGRYVHVGEKILTLADPSAVRADVLLPVEDAGVIEDGAPVTLFLDAAPFDQISGRLESASHEPEQTPEGIMAYRLRVSIQTGPNPPRIGSQGVARVGGGSVPLLIYLTRRPLTALRQWVGW